MKELEKVKSEKLEILKLEKNIKTNVDIVANVNFKEHKEIDLSYYSISDMKILQKVKCEKLEILNL